MNRLRWGGFLSHVTNEQQPSCRSFTNTCCLLVTMCVKVQPDWNNNRHKKTAHQPHQPRRGAGAVHRHSSYRALLTRPQPLIGRLQPSVISLIRAAPVASLNESSWISFPIKTQSILQLLTNTKTLFSWFNAEVSTFPDPSPPSSFKYKIKKIYFLCY